jgi:hypothetical protein
VCSVKQFSQLLINLGGRTMVEKILCTFAAFAALLLVFSGPAALQDPQVYRGIAQAGVPPVGTEEPCIANPCLFYAGDFDANGQNPNGLWNNNSIPFGIEGVGVPAVSYEVESMPSNHRTLIRSED